MENDDGGAGTTESNSDWAELTHECLTNILARLTISERWTGPMLVCKPWLQACKDPSLQSAFDLENQFKFPSESTRWLSSEFEMKIDAMLRTVVDWSDGSLTVIRVRHCSDRSLSFAAERCRNLQVLSIKSCPNVTDASMASVAFQCPNLKELDISYCYKISHETLVLIGINCPNLKTLKRNLLNWLDPSPQDDESEAAAIGKYMPHLELLELRFSKLTARGLTLIAKGCLNLEYLDLFGCANLMSRDISIATTNLKNLIKVENPIFDIPRSVIHTERYGHWNLYDERFQTDVFRI